MKTKIFSFALFFVGFLGAHSTVEAQPNTSVPSMKSQRYAKPSLVLSPQNKNEFLRNCRGQVRFQRESSRSVLVQFRGVERCSRLRIDGKQADSLDLNPYSQKKFGTYRLFLRGQRSHQLELSSPRQKSREKIAIVIDPQ